MYEGLLRVGSLVNVVPYNPRYSCYQFGHERAGLAMIWRIDEKERFVVAELNGDIHDRLYLTIGDFYILQY
jgi:hypothetical protein